MNANETDQQRAGREMAKAREKHAEAYFAAKAALGDPEEAAFLKAATQDKKRSYRRFVKSATAGLVAQIENIAG